MTLNSNEPRESLAPGVRESNAVVADTTVPHGSDKRQPARILGLDGKSYPGAWLSADDRTRLVGIAHRLSHEEGLSVRQIIARIADDYGIRRSVGWVSTALRTWKCSGCSGGPNART
ncbi:hypothetical protein [Streptomyces sp. NPDC002855]|uniref:hypothetical protein n=1 Tax=Streptomyces sp. NPDC002855 TaxID=3154437 RepID=UPI003331B55F